MASAERDVVTAFWAGADDGPPKSNAAEVPPAPFNRSLRDKPGFVFGILVLPPFEHWPDSAMLVEAARKGTHNIRFEGNMVSTGDGIIGVSDHGGWAVMLTVAGDGALLDRRRVELVDQDLPKIPHHSEGQGLPLDEAVALVERVQASAERHARLRLKDVAMTLPGRIAGVALRQCPELPPTIAGRIKDYRAQNVADWVMYRRALAAAAEARGWAVHWYDAKQVVAAASEALRIKDFDVHFLRLRKSLGPPWSNDHKLAMAAAIVAAAPKGMGSRS